MEIINQDFVVGEKYVGRTNGIVFEVAKKERVPVKYRDVLGSDGRLIEPYFFSDVIYFKDIKTDNLYAVEIETARRLLLDKVKCSYVLHKAVTN